MRSEQSLHAVQSSHKTAEFFLGSVGLNYEKGSESSRLRLLTLLNLFLFYAFYLQLASYCSEPMDPKVVVFFPVFKKSNTFEVSYNADREKRVSNFFRLILF